MYSALGTAVYSHLAGGTALTALLASGSASIFYGRVRPESAEPYLLWNVVSDEPTNATPRDERPVLIDIRGIAADPDVAGQIGDAIEARMKVAIDVSGWDTVHQRLMQAIETIETMDGVDLWHDGGRFQVEIHQLNS